ncbi:unnamed protein product [Somion occarium]|uniref:Thiamine-binding protein domain-containing protein n=1 Tax=Somion occarium TaxID=3059160 RepID=A0ABP1DFW9_9APHY
MASTSAPSQDLYAVADFCLIPMGTGEPSVAEYIAECSRVLQKSGLKHQVSICHEALVRCTISLTSPSAIQLHGYGTNLEGPWSEVVKAIHDCHAAVHAKGVPRIATDIRIGTRVDREIEPGTGNEGKVKRVQDILAKDSAA